MSKRKWEIGPIKLVDGNNASIYRFCEKRQRYVGEIEAKTGGFYAAEWTEEGYNTAPGSGERLLNLALPPKKTMRFKRFIRLCNNGDWYSFLTEEQARAKTGKDTFAMFVIDREVEEGEGLE